MSATERGKQKQQVEVSEEEDFEIFVRKSLGQLSKGQKHNFTLALVSEQYNYDTRSASLQHPNPSSFRTLAVALIKGRVISLTISCPLHLFL